MRRGTPSAGSARASHDPLIDRFDARGAMATLFTEPNEDGTYEHSDPVPFGQPLALPAPFDVTLLTVGFPV